MPHQDSKSTTQPANIKSQSEKPSKFSRATTPLIIGMAVYVLVKLLVFELNVIPSESMYPTIHVGDRVIANRLAKSSANVGDIVTFKSPEDKKTVLIKRIVATGGETVDLVDGNLVVDGQIRAFDEQHGENYPLSSKVKFPLKLAEDEVFCMGDNRKESADSREFGPVKRSTLIGKVIATYWPQESMRTFERSIPTKETT